MFSEEPHHAFKTHGFVRLRRAVPTAEVRRMYDRIWTLLAHKGLDQDDRSTWRPGPVGKLHDLKAGEPTPEDAPSVRAALDAVFSDGRQPARNWGQPLVNFPQSQGPWLLPASIWHFDHLYRRPDQIYGVNVFLFIDDVEPGGGGTVAIQSSPLLMERMLLKRGRIDKLSDQNKAFLRSHPWLAGLKTAKKNQSIERNRRYMTEDADIDGIAARVVELTGEAGDVFVCHPAMCHAPAPNVSDRPSIMRTQRIF